MQIRSNLFLALLTSFIFHKLLFLFQAMLRGISKTVPREKRVFKVDISGDERNIAAAIDKYLHPIKDKYGIVRNNQVAILCRSNSTAFKVGENLSTPYKIFEETVLDYGQLFVKI